MKINLIKNPAKEPKPEFGSGFSVIILEPYNKFSALLAKKIVI